MLRAIHYDPGTGTSTAGGRELLNAWGDAQLWVDLEQSDLDTERDGLIATLDLHPLPLQDSARGRHPPKLAVFDNGSAINTRTRMTHAGYC